jgi:geranylgeranyl pyrophosphate synthase
MYDTVVNGSSVSESSFSGVFANHDTAQIASRRSKRMKKLKDINACIAQLRAVQGRNDTEPEQTKYIDDAIELLRQLRRKSNPTRAEVARLVRGIAEALLRALIK